MSEGIQVFPDRLNPEGAEFQASIEVLSGPPERELSQEDKFEIKSFERSLAHGDIPFGLLAPEMVRQPEKTLAEVYRMEIRDELYCLDYFVQDEVFNETFPEASDIPVEQRESYARRELARRMAKPELRPTVEQRDASGVYAQNRLKENLLQLYEQGEYDPNMDPRYERALHNPAMLIEKAQAARSIRSYYRDVEKQMQASGSGKNGEVKRSLLTMHQARINMVLTSCYQDAITLIRQDREGQVLSDEQKEQLKVALPALRLRAERDTSVEAGFVDRESFARFLDRLDKYARGIDREGDGGHVPQALKDLRERYEYKPGVMQPKYTYGDVDPELLKERKVMAGELQRMIEMVLSEYGLLSESRDYDPDSDDRAADNKWRVVIDPKKTRKSLGVNDVKRCVMVPQKFSRTLNQVAPAGALPLIDHEITHVLQHENANRLELELFQSLGAARTALWSETGGVFWEQAAQEALFGQDRRVNFTYLAAIERRLSGGTIPECALEFLQEQRRTNPAGDVKKQAGTALLSTLRVFRGGGEMTVGTSYLANSAPLEYAEQRVLAEAIPDDKQWLFYLGKNNLQSIAELYRLGWINKESLLLPERLPSDIVEPYVRAEILKPD